ncbi:hypothetical protein CK203_055565 [Vitis vinifera]|uniref:Uncharacterized protein n=1 Tax=Vitis vinifera TaxID=29760 RepID=A0A438GXN8_VITVI|nr:hypothetical protein CK203_055565 [Vitis vinifera]
MPEATSIVPPYHSTCSTDGRHSCSAGPAYCYHSSHSAASGTPATPQPDIPGPSEPIASTKETARADVPIQSTDEAAT